MGLLFIGTEKPPDGVPVSDYRIDLVRFATELIRNWPHAKVRSANEQYLMYWEVSDGASRWLLGTISPSFQTISFSISDYDYGIAFIVWYRRFVPETVRLFLYFENLGPVFEVTPELANEEIQRMLEALINY